MPTRAHWKGYLKLSLVSCPIALYPAVSAAERVSFRQVNKQTGNRLRQQLVDAVTGEVVDSTDKGRGYEVAQNQFLMVDDTELDTAQQEARRTPFVSSRLTREPSEERATVTERTTEVVPPAARKVLREPVVAAPEQTPPPPPARIENNHTIEIERCVPTAQIDA